MIPIARKVTEIGGDGKNRPPRPITEFKTRSAYVLLGNPGEGKTTVFEQEANRTDACFVRARDLGALEIECHLEWHGKTLFIDGLDEIRAGSPDARTPLDHIRQKLDRLGCPPFRLSCRGADWLGTSDQVSLETVSPDGRITVLHLDSLADDDIIDILREGEDPTSARTFVENARNRGLGELLKNPQNLKMLKKAVSDGNWPDSRTETFEMACRAMIREENDEHEIATRNSPVTECQLLESAGFLCAGQLIAGNFGYARTNKAADAGFPCLNELDYKDMLSLRRATERTLFRASGEGRVEPAHRHIAEYLAASYITSQIHSGLPLGRLLALITGEGGIVVSELRGLSAWLAALCISGRGEIIGRDPSGVVLYGDVRRFEVKDKLRLLAELRAEAKKNPWFHSPNWIPLGALATSDMEGEFEKILTVSDRDESDQLLAHCVLAAMVHGERFPSLDETLTSVIRDNTWWPRVRHAALDAVCSGARTDPQLALQMKAILKEIRRGTIVDFDDEIVGKLLTILYPQTVTPEEVFDYLHVPTAPDYIGHYAYFWSYTLSESSSDEDLRTLLDQLASRYDSWHSTVNVHSSLYVRMATDLLDKGLKVHGESIDTARLYQWLGIGLERDGGRLRGSEASIGRIKAWLEDRPEIQKSILRFGQRQCRENEDLRNCMGQVQARLDPAERPADYGLWCLQHMPGMPDDVRAKYMLEEAVNAVAYQQCDQGLSLELIEEFAGRDEKHQSWLEGFLVCPVDEQDWKRRQKNRQYKAKKQRERDEWIRYVKSRKVALEDGSAPPRLLHELAAVYYGRFTDLKGDTPVERLRHFLGHDEELVETVRRSMRCSLDREDIPTVEEIIRIDVQNNTNFLGRPVLAGLAENFMRSPDDIFQLGDSQLETVTALYLAEVPGNDISWYRSILDKRPELVSGILVKYVTAVLRSRKKHVAGVHTILNALVYSDEYAPVARLATLAMLKAFPARCTNRQLKLLDALLKSAMRHRHVFKEEFLALVRKKLGLQSMNSAQRVYWLATGLIVDPGQYREKFADFIPGNENRTRHLANFLWYRHEQGWLPEDLPVSIVGLLIQTLGCRFAPYSLREVHWTSPATKAADFISGLIKQLVSNTGIESTDVLKSLIKDGDLVQWHSRLRPARSEQLAARWNASFQHPKISQVVSTLNNQAPANAGDLAVLVMSHLRGLANRIRNSNTDDYKQYWNHNPGSIQLDNPKHEDACRDTLLSDLKERLAPLDVDAQPEGQYADDTRADIRVSVRGENGFAVPVEIKKNTHADLWRSIRDQLIALYVRDPGADDFGIYLVFWFGADRPQPPAPCGKRPGSAEELENRLRATLSTDENRKISVCVVDVSKPEK